MATAAAAGSDSPEPVGAGVDGSTTSSSGLTAAEAAELLVRHGRNTVPRLKPPPVWRQFAAQFVHFFAIMLWIAACLAVLGGMPQLGLAIVAVVIINGLFAFAQEFRAERAAAKLRSLMPASTRVRRDGEVITIDAEGVVPGDVVILAEGDRVPADLVCRSSEGLEVDTSTLTGESVPETPGAGETLAAGCYVVAGSAEALVTATGSATRFAEIARLTQQPRRRRTPLERDIRRLVRTVAVLALAVGGVFFAVMLALGMPPGEGFIFGIGVTVALVPEGLLPTVTLSLALGAQRMSQQQALVRRLESVETLGATTMICTDKTGTLTQNRMNVVRVWTPAGSANIHGVGYEPIAEVECDDTTLSHLRECAAAAREASRGGIELKDGEWRAFGDPMDAAVHALAGRVGLGPADPDERDYLPFDPIRRAVVSIRVRRVSVKGAPEAVFHMCADVPESARESLESWMAAGLRVLAVAIGGPQVGGTAPTTDLRLVGLLAFEDPPRDGVADAIAECRDAGIALAMITGDHPTTARAVAAEIGLALPGSPVLLGSDLPLDDAELGQWVDRDGVVLARVPPEDKHRIARALRARGRIVAMTGDGVNDAPALREADIGIAMGKSGTDVAREAADLVLLDDHFATIVAAVQQGRATFLNARRFLTYHLTDNVAELTPFLVWGASGGAFPVALGVLQILALDLGTDTLPAAALGAERPSARVAAGPPVSGALLDRTTATRAFGVLGPMEAAWSLAVFVAAMAAEGWRPGDPFPSGAGVLAASGAAFLTVVVMQLANGFACRSTTQPPWRLGWGSNRYLIVAVAISAAFGLGCLLVAPIAGALGQAPPPIAVLPLILVGPALLLTVDAAHKRLRRRISRTRAAAPQEHRTGG